MVVHRKILGIFILIYDFLLGAHKQNMHRYTHCLTVAFLKRKKKKNKSTNAILYQDLCMHWPQICSLQPFFLLHTGKQFLLSHSHTHILDVRFIWDHEKHVADGAQRERVREARHIKSFPADTCTLLGSGLVWPSLVQHNPG